MINNAHTAFLLCEAELHNFMNHTSDYQPGDDWQAVDKYCKYSHCFKRSNHEIVYNVFILFILLYLVCYLSTFWWNPMFKIISQVYTNPIYQSMFTENLCVYNIDLHYANNLQENIFPIHVYFIWWALLLFCYVWLSMNLLGRYGQTNYESSWV